MTCKIKGAVLFDEEFLMAFEAVRSGIAMEKKVAYKFFVLANEIGKTYQELEEKREAIMISHAVKNNKGEPKKDSKGYRYKGTDGVEKVKEEVMALLMEEIELECGSVSSDEITEKGIVPSLIQSLAVISPVLNK